MDRREGRRQKRRLAAAVDRQTGRWHWLRLALKHADI